MINVPKNVYLIQPNYHSIFQGKVNYWLPYSVGIIWAYAQQFDEITDNYRLEQIVYSRQPVDEMAATVKPNSVLIFSNYIWNWNYNTTLAKKIKEQHPDSYIIFGGPQVTKRPIETGFFKQHPYIDTIILGEGEDSLTNCLRDLTLGKKQRIHQPQRLDDLDIPSPYLTGVFDDLIASNPNTLWNTVIETNRGCPFACTFCDWGSLIYSKVKKFSIERVQAELEWIAEHKIDYLTFADANFGIFKERDYEITELLCKVKQQYGFPKNINLCYTKNSTENIINIVKLLAEANLNRGLTITFQSMDDAVLESIKRTNMEINQAERLLTLLEQQQLSYYSELIIGLPLETVDTWKQGHLKLLDMGQHQCLDIFYAMILENSELNHPDYKNKYGIASVEVENFMHFNTEINDPIIETISIVRSTNTMSADDLVDAFMYSWLIVNLHSYGWTQVYSRFLQETGQVSYSQFYDQLLDDLVNNRLGLLSEYYHEYRARLVMYLDDNHQFVESGHSTDLIRDVQQYLHINKHQVEQVIKQYVDQYGVSDQLYDYQSHFVASSTTSYPYTVDLDIGIQNTILNKQPYSKDTQSCSVNITEMYSNQKDFLDKLVTWRRNGWGKTHITK